MLLIDYNSPKSLNSFLESHGYAMCKRFGQNFLINESFRNKLIDVLKPSGDEVVWEVGPGLGSMTSILLQRTKSVVAFEIDKGFVAALNVLFEKDILNKKLAIVAGDALKTLPATFINESAKTPLFSPLLFGNLPYNIGSVLIASLFENGIRFSRAVFTLQKEVATRLTAKAGTGEYSSITVLVSTFCNVKIICDLGANLFFPAPRVTSTAVMLTLKSRPPAISGVKYSHFVRAAFCHRRKTLFNNLRAGGYSCDKITSSIKSINKDSAIRAEVLTCDEFVKLFKLLAS